MVALPPQTGALEPSSAQYPDLGAGGYTAVAGLPGRCPSHCRVKELAGPTEEGEGVPNRGRRVSARKGGPGG